jgi:hypothetical protein
MVGLGGDGLVIARDAGQLGIVRGGGQAGDGDGFDKASSELLWFCFLLVQTGAV